LVKQDNFLTARADKPDVIKYNHLSTKLNWGATLSACHVHPDHLPATRGEFMKKFLVPVLIAFLLTVGGAILWRAERVMSGQPPRAWVAVGGQRFAMVINGYQWSNGNSGAVADAALHPARNLEAIPANAGATARLIFDSAPESVHVTMWSNGKESSTREMSGTTFSLPHEPGDYTYEVTGTWGKNYVNYDFEVRVY
jgi:hypothetical protein